MLPPPTATTLWTMNNVHRTRFSLNITLNQFWNHLKADRFRRPDASLFWVVVAITLNNHFQHVSLCIKKKSTILNQISRSNFSNQTNQTKSSASWEKLLRRKVLQAEKTLSREVLNGSKNLIILKFIDFTQSRKTTENLATKRSANLIQLIKID